MKTLIHLNLKYNIKYLMSNKITMMNIEIRNETKL
jgi:hypothetical protein